MEARAKLRGEREDAERAARSLCLTLKLGLLSPSLTLSLSLLLLSLFRPLLLSLSLPLKLSLSHLLCSAAQALCAWAASLSTKMLRLPVPGQLSIQ